ncbi:MAG: agmatinase [Flavobacteriales bacterium]|nr:agmatinase [Flavobacteriales bacterium]MDG2247289.1 agmatinase [Flavobacteriales bacterium]
MMENNYAGIPNEFASQKHAKVELICVPYDGTSTWVKGADKGPTAFLDASENMELYDIESGTEVYTEGIFLAENVTENSSPEEMTSAVRQRVAEAISRKKLVTLFGGEHSVSIGAIQAHAEAYPNLTVLQLDAHADLRPSYHGSTCNHACALFWASKNTNLLQVGIRSMDKEEVEHMDFTKTWLAEKCHHMADSTWIKEVEQACTEDVYITIDLDAFDPSILPSTGTPEPGGLQWYQTLELLKTICATKNVVGFDIVELCPNPGDKSSDFLAAKLYYKLLTYLFYSSKTIHYGSH